jgi:hypothetical protein
MNLIVRAERERRSILIRLWWKWNEVAYIVLGLRGLRAEIEFPSGWHEHRAGWVRLGFGLVTFAFSFPWPWVVPDEHQCSGPTFGFCFFDDGLHLHWGKSKGRRDDPFTIIAMPWRWHHKLHEVLGEPEAHQFRYTLRSGEVQERTATIKPERRMWLRPWFPWKREERYIDIEFSDEVGERSGTWKGGVLGMGFGMLPNERPVEALRRMEKTERI